MNVGIIGCGLIGKKRALALSPDDSIVGCYDVDDHVRESFARQFRCRTYADNLSLLQDDSCEAVIVAVVNKFAKDLAIEALEHSKHVLVEKPLGRNVAEAKEIMDRWRQGGKATTLKVGFNHRFHPAIWKAKQLVDEGAIGQLISIRARYGHGGRPGMENEWRASRDLCGGGELLDQGVHLIDLIRWFGGNVAKVYGKVETKVWDMEVEDSAFAILETEQAVTASFHVSWFNWKNIFSFEVFGVEGYIRVEGLGGSYGPETLEIGRRKKEGGRPHIETLTFPPEDSSWEEEWKEFKLAIQEKREPLGNGYDGLKANEVVEAIYESSKRRCEVSLRSMGFTC
jgi:predicted dehydrogenase